MSGTMPLQPTFVGFIGDTVDALIIFEACLSGKLAHVPRRPHDRERTDLIKSGNIFVYEEHASGIKRWTDSISWSPSRILGNYLLYRELEKPFPPGEKKRARGRNGKTPQQSGGITRSRPRNTVPYQTGLEHGMEYPAPVEDDDRALVGSLVDSYDFKEKGLVKKTISITFNGVPHHLVSYYTVEDVKSGTGKMMRQSIRPLRALSFEVLWIARRTQASLAKPGDLIPNKLEESQEEANPEPRFLRSIQALHLKPLKREAEHGIPSCDLQLRSYSVQPLEFFSDFALRAAYYLGLPAYGPVPLPRITERWTVPRDNFIFKKAQENFERKTLRRLIQIRDGNPETVQLWLAYLRKHQLYGVGMKANMWEFSELGVGKKMDALPESEKGEIDAKWEHLGQTKTIGTVEKVEELLNQRRFREAAGLKVPPTTSV
ncbi:hypothetical protein IL306_007267 [Fusarium sp. DS 682]|nr:hypothetical protein IL306_007267 [Fusarium sp. DS 682]